MQSDANTVNIDAAKRGYHHGDLRSALIDMGLLLLEKSDAEHLSLREIAREVGVSAPAVYRHFPHKTAFLEALAKEGLSRLATAQSKAASAKGHSGFAASGQAYVHFAIANPSLFRLIFASGALKPGDRGDDQKGSAGWQLHQHATLAAGRAADEDMVQILAYRAWSLVHGLAMLIIDRQISRKEGLAMIDKIVSSDSIRV
jgi:AcrR family transcriptional regulator